MAAGRAHGTWWPPVPPYGDSPCPPSHAEDEVTGNLLYTRPLPDMRVRIKAFAGCGKTSTLLAVAQVCIFHAALPPHLLPCLAPALFVLPCLVPQVSPGTLVFRS